MRLQNGRSALDVGCGSGYLTVAMARINPALKVHGIDTFPKVVALSEENALKAVRFACYITVCYPFTDNASYFCDRLR